MSKELITLKKDWRSFVRNQNNSSQLNSKLNDEFKAKVCRMPKK